MSSKSTASITGLPQELFDSITCRMNRADLSSLSRTCRKLRSQTIHLVFENVTMLWSGTDKIRKGDDTAGWDDIVTPRTAGWDYIAAERFREQNPNVLKEDSDVECPRLDLLLRSVLENPHCARLIKTINLQCFRYRTSVKQLEGKPKLPSRPDTENYRALVLETMEKVGLDQSKLHEKFKACLIRENEFDAVIGFLILLCPNVTSLTLGLDVLINNPFLNFVFQECTSRFQNLEDITLGASLEDNTSDLARIPSRYKSTKGMILSQTSYLALFSLPRLKQAELPIPFLLENKEEQELAWPGYVPPSFSPIGTLDLPVSSIRPRLLQKVLQLTPNITRLEYHWRPWYGLGTTIPRNCEELASALMCVKHSLKHFRFELCEWSDIAPGVGEEGEFTSNPDYEYTIGRCSLKGLTKLESAIMPSCVLLGWHNHTALIDVLPASLTTLCLADDCWTYDTWQKDEDSLMLLLQQFFSENWKECLPRLREISVAYEDWEKDDIVSLLRENGIRCQILPSNEPSCV
ncbi:hypothetical protein DM02DRAFT_315249 [Periconia macrospinosa]|uniref:F-box domain-containing protein n=1 Tax=Periconia macrospinosa TaxID=97972 RepID=A0A2V1DXX0_9PLEO|nr:hypothetical protein DM02DRAFT_315249 [Periconia macrospinosa]